MKNLFTTTLAVLIYCTTGLAQQRQLWVTTTEGGLEGRGAIFMADSTGTNFHSVYDCDTTGSQILGGLVMAPNGLLYGVTATGGYNDSCVICTYDPLTSEFTNIYDLALEPDSGYGARSGLILGSDGKLYGLAADGGIYGGGVLYMIDPSDNSYHIKHHFGGSLGNDPSGGLIELSDGKLYGLTGLGGNLGGGVLFSFDLSSSVYSVLHHLDFATGAWPQYTSLIRATNGKLYGMTRTGGAYSSGVIFSFDLIGNIYTNIYNFSSGLGSSPYGSLMQASNGKLYGLTHAGGGIFDGGVLFSFDLLTSSYNVLVSFIGTNGMYPTRSLTQTSSGKLFGTTSLGGNYGNGVIFNFDIATNTYTKVYDFDGITGGNPNCEVYESGPAITSSITAINKAGQLSLSPNPATNTITITIDETLIGNTATVTDITGREITAVKLTTVNGQLTTENFTNGVYFVTVTDKDGRSVTKKLILQK